MACEKLPVRTSKHGQAVTAIFLPSRWRQYKSFGRRPAGIATTLVMMARISGVDSVVRGNVRENSRAYPSLSLNDRRAATHYFALGHWYI